jgi:hypothetical protein
LGEGRCTQCTPHPHQQHAAILGLAVDLTAGKLGLHWWYLLGIGLVTLVIGWLLRPRPATPPKPSSLVSGNVGNRLRMRDSKVWVQQSEGHEPAIMPDCSGSERAGQAMRTTFSAPTGLHSPVRPGQLGPSDLPAQQGHLVAQHENLRLLGGAAAGEQAQPVHRRPHSQVVQSKRHEPAIMPDHAWQ